MKNLLEFLVKELVSKPKEVKVEEETAEDGTIRLTLTVDPEDMGLVIGKGGRMIQALRTLLRTAAVKTGQRVFLELKEVGAQLPRPS